MECALLSSSPGLLATSPISKTRKARLIAAKLENVIIALNGEDLTGITGHFPDRDVFHWDEGRA
jgi:hypothetical protein